MPRFYFHIDDGLLSFRDQEGIDLSDFTSAKAEAVRVLSELLKDSAFELAGAGHLIVIVEAVDGSRLKLSATAEKD